MDSVTLAAHLAANPHNLARVPGFPALSPHWIAAARFEAQGRAAYPYGRNPYNVGTMAHSRWAAGWHQGFTASALRVIIDRDADEFYWHALDDHGTVAAYGTDFHPTEAAARDNALVTISELAAMGLCDGLAA